MNCKICGLRLRWDAWDPDRNYIDYCECKEEEE